LFFNAVNAQKPAELKSSGEKAFDNGRWEMAKNFLLQYQSQKPGDLEVLAKLGIAQFHLGQGGEAKRYLQYVSAKTQGSGNPDWIYYLARTLHGLSEWQSAIDAYKSFLRNCGEKHKWRANAAENIRRCVQGMQALENAEIALVENLGDSVNSMGDEFAPLPSVNYSDRIYFAAAKEGCNGGLRNEDGFEDTNKGTWSSDMFAAKSGNSGWETAGSLGGLLNSSRFEIPLGFNSNGQVLYFFRGFSTYSGEILADTAAKKDEYALDPPVFISPLQPLEGDIAPYFFNDRTLVFASRRAGGQGGLDLWYTTFSDSTWSEPLNLGPEINSAYDETTPFLALDGRTLYFSSNRPESMGGLDIYRVFFNDAKLKWEAPSSLGYPVNSPADDSYFRLAKDGQTAFFSSERLGGKGGLDLYIAYYKEPAPEQIGKSTPALFCEVGNNSVHLSQKQEKAIIPCLMYENEKDLLNADNLKSLELIAETARKHPETNLLVTLFADDSGQAKFDLYYGIKRAEIIGKGLTDRGISATRITLRSVGAAYPIARTVLDGQENTEAKRLNKRAETIFANLEGAKFESELRRPLVSPLMATTAIDQYDKQLEGVSYRVEAAVTRQILANDALAMFGDLMIESQPGVGSYRYLAGCFNKYEQASKLQKEMSGLGFSEARVCAYLNGLRISKAEAVGFVKKYPDLASYIKG
jgi:outer membrane protein OmpA-like peptidoglycan-associated protein